VEEGEYVSDGEDIGDADTDLDELESDNEIIPADDDEEEDDDDEDDVPIGNKRSRREERPPAQKRRRVRQAVASDSE